jgi:hypothetical protein
MADTKHGGEVERYLNTPAQAELERCVSRFRDELVVEASRLEAAANSGTGDPEVTSSMVRDADLLLRRGYRRARITKGMVAVKIGAVVGSFLTGLLADFDKLANPRWLTAFILLLAVSIALAVIVTVKE